MHTEASKLLMMANRPAFFSAKGVPKICFTILSTATLGRAGRSFSPFSSITIAFGDKGGRGEL